MAVSFGYRKKECQTEKAEVQRVNYEHAQRLDGKLTWTSLINFVFKRVKIFWENLPTTPGTVLDDLATLLSGAVGERVLV